MKVRCVKEIDGRILMDLGDFRAVLLQGKTEKLTQHNLLKESGNSEVVRKVKDDVWAEIKCLDEVTTLLEKYELQCKG